MNKIRHLIGSYWIPALYLLLIVLFVVYLLGGECAEKSYDYEPDCAPDYISGCY